MCKRETKLMTLYFKGTKGMYKNVEDIMKITDALKAKFEYIRAHNDDYFINAFIGVSHLNPRYGYYKYLDNKKPGKNKLVRRHKPRKNATFLLGEPWHLHILIEANPGETIGEQIADYLNKKFKMEIVYKRRVDEGFFPYVMNQCRYIRYVQEDRPTDLVQHNFRKIYEENYKPLTKGKLADMKKAARKEGKKFRKSAEAFPQDKNRKGGEHRMT